MSGSFLARCAGQLAGCTKAMFGVKLFIQNTMENLKSIVKAPPNEPLNRKALFSQTGYIYYQGGISSRREPSERQE